jgi:hypothetical protein
LTLRVFTRQEVEVKKLLSIVVVVVALCALLAIPAAAGTRVEMYGSIIPFEPPPAEYHPIGKGEDDHYCQISVDVERTFLGTVEGTVLEHYEILKLGPCETGPATYPSRQRAWGTFEGQIWDGEGMRAGSCDTFWKGGWDWAEDGVTLQYGGRLTLHACTGELKGAHAELDIEFIPGEGPPSYTGQAFYSAAP